MLFVLIFLIFITDINCLDGSLLSKYFTWDYKSDPQCQLQKEVFRNSLENKSEWAIRMLDAFGRIPQAITQGNTIDLGTYDQCLNIFEKLDNITVKGKYCFGGLSVPSTDLEEALYKYLNISDFQVTCPARNVLKETTLLISVCVPDACLPSDFFGQNAKDSDCETKNESKALDAGDIAFLIFLLFILLAMVISTIYDLYLQKHSKGPYKKVLLAFSVYTNGKTITKVNQQPGQILFFNGLKVISMFWVVLGHRYESIEMPVINKAELEDWKAMLHSMYILLFALAVDTFFFISAALLSYSFLKSHRNSNKQFNIPLYYIHRYFRLTPAMAALYFFQITLARRIVSGPYAPPHELTGLLGTPCKENWWSYFLYIQNYVSPKNMCLVHTWYVNVDMQFILISPFILLLMLRYPKHVTYFGLPALIVVTTIHPILISYFYELSLDSEDFVALYYLTSHMRISGWLVGILFGAFMLDFKENELKYRIRSNVVTIVGWAMVFAVFAVQFPLESNCRQDPSLLKSMLYYPIQRTLWPICLCWISYACLCGKGGFISELLSLPVFQVLSKIIYSTYLIHVTLIAMEIKHSRSLVYFTEYELIRAAIADVVVALVAGTVWALAFEYPGIKIEQAIFGGREEKNNGNQNKKPVLLNNVTGENSENINSAK